MSKRKQSSVQIFMISYLEKSRAMGGHHARVRFMCLWSCIYVMRKYCIVAVMSEINLYPRLKGYNGPVISS